MNTPSRPRRALAAAAVASVLFAGTACTSDHKKQAAATPTTPTPTTSSSSPTPTPTPKPKPAPKNPLTGIGGVPANPVIAVKIDDTAPGRPQRNIDLADVVYIEAVEGGLTRLAAVYATHMPTVGYVRSTRPSDPDLLLQYGKITEAYSGGAHDSLPRVHRSGITSWSNDAGAAYYFRAPHAGRPRLHQPGAEPRQSGEEDQDAAREVHRLDLQREPDRPAGDDRDEHPDSGARLEQRRHGGDRSATSRSCASTCATSTASRQTAADGKPVAAANVIVQQCKVVAHPADTDVNGNPSQFTYTVGTGAVSVFRQGKRINGTWSRPKLDSGTTLRTTAGKALPLNPGNTWVVLTTKTTPVRS